MFDRYSRIIIRQTDGSSFRSSVYGVYELRFEISFFFFFSISSLKIYCCWASIARESSSSSQKSKAIFYSARQWYLQRAMGCEGKRKESKKRDEKNFENSVWIGSLQVSIGRQSLDEAKNSRFSFFFIIPSTSILSLFFFFIYSFITLFVLLLT